MSGGNFGTVPRDEFIKNNLPLVHSLANRFRGRGIEYEELFAAGSVGLVKACDNFDSGRGLCFSTYAVPVILGEIKRLFRDGGTVRVSRGLKELSLRAARVHDEIAAEGREPRVSEIAQRLGVTPEEAAEAVAAGQPTVSLTSCEDGGEFDLPEDSGENETIDRLALRQCLSELPEKDMELIMLRYFRGKTQCETAALLGMTQVQVSRRERKIILSLREQLV
ncbi:MAG: sigma-70 family RNA polymerase sigma factor [Oscillospiraceae bacterium]